MILEMLDNLQYRIRTFYSNLCDKHPAIGKFLHFVKECVAGANIVFCSYLIIRTINLALDTANILIKIFLFIVVFLGIHAEGSKRLRQNSKKQ